MEPPNPFPCKQAEDYEAQMLLLLSFLHPNWNYSVGGVIPSSRAKISFPVAGYNIYNFTPRTQSNLAKGLNQQSSIHLKHPELGVYSVDNYNSVCSVLHLFENYHSLGWLLPCFSLSRDLKAIHHLFLFKWYYNAAFYDHPDNSPSPAVQDTLSNRAILSFCGVTRV